MARRNKKYAKIKKITKVLFLREVFLDKMSIKYAAQKFKINYSTGKTLTRLFRQSPQSLQLPEFQKESCQKTIQEDSKKTNLVECTYRLIELPEVKLDYEAFSCSSNSFQNKVKLENIEPERRFNRIQVFSRVQFPSYK